MKILILAVISFIFSLSSQASICGDVNLYDSNKLLNEQPIIRQGNMNTCYAHSVSMIHNIDNENNKTLDPYWVAFLHKNKIIHWEPKDMDYSFLTWAYKDIKKRGICSIDTLKREYSILKNGVPYSDDQLFFLLKTFFKAKKRLNIRKQSKWHRAIFRTLAIIAKEENKFDRSWSKEDILKVLKPIRFKAARRGFFRFLKKYVYKSCKRRNNFKVRRKLKSFGMGYQSNSKLQKKIAHFLNKGKALSIGHCPDVTYDPGAVNKKPISIKPRLLKAVSGKCGAHYAVLVGSRETQNSCEYLMRNSYGEGFWPDKSIPCYCENRDSGQRYDCYKESFNIKKERVLGCWINGKKLLDSTYELNAFN